MSKLDWKAFSGHFHKSWHPRMKKIIESPELWEIYQELKKQTGQGHKITPMSKDTFAAFQSDISHTSVVILAQDPYPQIDMNTCRATGDAFDCRNYGKVSPSLEKLYQAFEDDCYNGLNLNYDMSNLSLEYLKNQGVMLANSGLTCQKDKPGSHYELWKPFWIQVFQEIFSVQNGLIFILMGKNAEFYESYCNSTHHVLKCEHPVRASYEKRKMIHNNVFSKSNEILKGSTGFWVSWLLDENIPF